MKILVPVDGSKSSLNAVKYAAKLSANMRSTDTVTLITVHDDQGFATPNSLWVRPKWTITSESSATKN